MLQGRMRSATRRVVALRECTCMQKSAVRRRALVRLESHAELGHLAVLHHLRDPLRPVFTSTFGLGFALTLAPALAVCAFLPLALHKWH